MAIPRSRALRALPFAVAAPLAVMPAAGAAAPAAPHTIVRSTYGIDGITSVVPAGRGVAVWSGALRGADVVSAEHRAGTPLWPAAVTVASAASGGVWGPQVATNAAGDTVAVWMVVDGTTLTVEGARRTGAGTWSALPRLATVADASSMARGDLPRTPLALTVTPDGTALVAYGTPDGSVTALRLAPAAAVWDAPVTVSPAVPGRLTGDPADLALASGPDGTATLLWALETPDGTRSISQATWSGVAWSLPSSLPPGAGGYYPDVDVTPAGETIAAWTTPDGNFAATRPSGGAWSAATRVGGGYSPEIAVGSTRVAVTWSTSGKGIALRNAPGEVWTSSSAPVAPIAAAFSQGDRLLVAGLLKSRVLAWARQTDGGAWGTARIASNQADLIGVTGAAIAPSASGPLATLFWSANVLEGRLGLPSGGTVVQGLDISAATGDAVGSAALFRLPAKPDRVNAYAVLAVYPAFTRYSGPTPVRIQTRRGGRWHTVGSGTADVEQAVRFRIGGPGRIQVRLAYGPGFRTVTNARTVRVQATALKRVIAGWYPLSVAASGRDLWVLSANRANTGIEIRLLDSATGRLRRGPVALPDEPNGASLVDTGNRVLLRNGDGTRLRVVDAALPGLVGPDATLTTGTCTPTCTATRISAGGTDTLPVRNTLGGTFTGQDGTVWGFTSGPAVPDEETPAILVNAAPGAVPVPRGTVGPMSAHAGRTGTAIAAATGSWVRSAFDALTWTPTAGAPFDEGTASAIGGTGACLWAANARGDRLTRIRPGAVPNGPVVRLGSRLLGSEAQLAVAPRAAWTVETFEQTLVKIPLPPC